MKFIDVLFPLAAVTIGGFLIATSIPLGSPHIFAYCLLSQIGTVPVDTDAFRIFCLKGPTDSGVTGVNGELNNLPDATVQVPSERLHTLYEYDAYDRWLPQSSGPADHKRWVPTDD